MLDGLIAYFLACFCLVVALVSAFGLIVYANSVGVFGWCALIGTTGIMVRLILHWWKRATTPPAPEPNPWGLPTEIPPMPVFDYTQFDRTPEWVEDAPDALDD